LLPSQSLCLMSGELTLRNTVDKAEDSSDGALLAYGCSDLSIGILDAKTLAVSSPASVGHHEADVQPLLKILAAHSFPPTALKFNPSANLLVSASADNTIRAIVVPPSFAGSKLSFTLRGAWLILSVDGIDCFPDCCPHVTACFVFTSLAHELWTMSILDVCYI
jgi:WD40 repeat protein